MIHEFVNPIPAISDLGECYIWYVEPSGMFENDVFTCILKSDGSIRHFNTTQLKITRNDTFDISKVR